MSVMLRSLMKYFSTLKEKFRISAQPCNILYECRNVSTNAQGSVATNCCLGQHGCRFWKKLKRWFLLILLNFTIHCTNGDFYLHSCHGNHKSILESKLQDCGNLSDILDHYVILCVIIWSFLLDQNFVLYIIFICNGWILCVIKIIACLLLFFLTGTLWYYCWANKN